MSSPPFKVKAVYEYSSPHEDDLHFPAGQIITVTEEEDDDWYSGEYVDASGDKKEGIFPRNFVEKYEPTAPPRPNRQSRVPKKAEPTPEPAPEPVVLAELPAQELEPEPIPEVHELPAIRDPPPATPKPQAAPSPPNSAKHAEVSPPTPAKAIPSSSKPSAPPPVSQKPSGGSFRDRIAAFNKAAPPVAPFKPSGFSSGGSNNFIRKPFVAPPPSKNAYVPIPREAPTAKIYRREEDPEIAASQNETQEQAERAGLAPTSNDSGVEEQPKPTSLKERIALLQKQQMEQAARHADAAAKKEKPKRPAKKRTESHHEDDHGEPLERKDTGETIGKTSLDSTREEAAPRRRKSSRGDAGSLGLQPRRSFGDGNEADMSGAGDTEEPEDISTEVESDDMPRKPPPPARAPTTPIRGPDVGEEEGPSEEETPIDEDEDEEEEEEEEDIDPEVRRKEELRARMAKMSGGMGMHGMFGPPGGMPMPSPIAPPKKKKTSGTSEKRSGEYGAEDLASSRAPPVPMMIPLPGMSRVRSPEEVNKQLEQEEDSISVATSRPSDEVPDVEDVVPEKAAPPVPVQQSTAPPIPEGRPAPPPIPNETRPTVPPPVVPPSAGSESDDELSGGAQSLSLETPKAEAPRPPTRPDEPSSPKSQPTRRTSYFGGDQGAAPSSPTATGFQSKRNSRLPPPIPTTPAPQPQGRAPPPPPPGALSRTSTGDQRPLSPPEAPHLESSEEEVTEYDGDYDTDIASAVPHKDALKAHVRDSSFDETPVRSPMNSPPPLPPTGPPRAVPPPLPSQPPPGRQSGDIPRAAPPPPPPKAPAPWEQDDYDPFNYTSPGAAANLSIGPSTPKIERSEEDLYSASPPRAYTAPVQERTAPSLPTRDNLPSPPNRGGPGRQSLDVQSNIQRSNTTTRRSVELSRMSMDSGFVANDVDLARSSFWWTQPKGVPPIFHGRMDILLEFEENSVKQGGKTIITKDLFVLFQDYSQTIITAQFDARDPADVTLEQRHEQPPSRLRQDQLEQAHEQFGRRISEAVSKVKETVVGDGTPQGLVAELLKPLSGALLPIGTRAYGAVVYGNLANASTQQNDEIRPGDIITLRNTKFQGKHGPMHAKYSMEVGKPDHVGVVAEWDGTKKKVRAWEQGRESKKVKLESFKLDDLRSGEVKIWRIMGRGWVGWSGNN